MTNSFLGLSKGFRVRLKERNGQSVFKSEISDNIINGNELLIEEQELELSVSCSSLALQFIVDEYCKNEKGEQEDRKGKRGQIFNRQNVSNIEIDIFDEFLRNYDSNEMER